jgi:predicted RNA-binding protein with RPS1 domain
MASDDTTHQVSVQQAATSAQSSTATEHTDEPTEAAPGGGKSQPTRIRIGSQRWAQRNPAAKPKPSATGLGSQYVARAAGDVGVPTTAAAAHPPTDGPKPEAGKPSATVTEMSHPVGKSSSASSGEEPRVESAPPAVTTSAATTQAATTSAPATPPVPKGAALVPRLIGGNAGPVQHVPTAAPVPVPNIRAPLGADLEQELSAAMGDLSLDEMLSGTGTAAAAPELETESRQHGKVVSVHRDNVFIDLGSQRQGILTLRSFTETPQPGMVVEVQIARFDPAEGLYELVLPGGAISVQDWSQISEGMVVEARVTGHNKGGLECEVNQLRGFIPASQCSLYRVEDLSQFVGQKLRAVVTEINPERQKLVLSPRAVMERDKAEAKTKLLTELEVGQTREGVVRSLQEFGAFVDLGGVDGLIHISQLSWDRIRHANEVLELGQKVKVKVQKIDQATGKIGLAFRDLADNPWAQAATKYSPRSTVQGTVTRLMEFGAFVRLESGIEGLIHISELSHRRVFRVSDVLQEGQQVEVLIVSVDAQQQRISLSLKALEARQAPAAKPEDEAPEPEAPAPTRRSNASLKGGIGGKSGGDKFGLKW